MNENFDLRQVRGFLLTGGAALVALVLLFGATYTVPPGSRGIMVTLGSVSPGFLSEGIGFKAPLISEVIMVPVKQQTRGVQSECYSSDLQQVSIELKVLYRIPEASIVKIFREYSGEPFDSLIAPRIQEALKEVTALQNAETIVKKREDIKTKALAAAQAKVGALLTIEDVIIQNISLSKELEHAIEAKMVQEQEAAKSRFIQQKAEVEANTAVIRAKGEAQAIRIRGEALKQTPALIQLQIVEKWDGKAPLVVGGGGSGANMILPLGHLKEARGE